MFLTTLQPLVDEYFGGVEEKQAQSAASNLGFVALCWAALAAHFILSDVLYLNVRSWVDKFCAPCPRLYGRI